MLEDLLIKLRKSNVAISLDRNDLTVKFNGARLPDDLLKEIRENKELLLQYLGNNRGEQAAAAISPVLPAVSYPLSSSQRMLWVLSRLESNSTIHHLPGSYLFTGSLDQSALIKAYNTLLGRHEILRTVFKEDESGEVKQFVCEPDDPIFNMRCKEALGMGEQEVREQTRLLLDTPFDLAAGPLLRVNLYHIGESKWVFTYVMHHIISDGISMNIMIHELMTMYNAFVHQKEHGLKDLAIQYKDYAVWQQDQLKGAMLNRHRSYWMKQFEGEVPVLELPGDRMRPAIKTWRGGTINKNIPADIAKPLRTLCRKKGCTLFMGLLSAVDAFLYRYTGQEDIVIGSPIAGREQPGLEEQIGYYVNILALRVQFSGLNSFSELLENVRNVTLAAYEHQVYPFDELVYDLNLQRNVSRGTLYDVMMILQNTDLQPVSKKQSLESLEVSWYGNTERSGSRSDIVFEFNETGDEIQIGIEYNSDIFDRETIQRSGDHFVQLLAMMVQQPDTPIARLDFILPGERERLFTVFNNTGAPYRDTAGIATLFEEQAAKTPAHTALITAGETLTYRELNERADRLAAWLSARYKLTINEFAAIRMERSANLVIAMLAVLKTGAACVPVDINCPEERLQYMKQEAGWKVMIDAQEMEAFRQTAHQNINEVQAVERNANSLAYVIYTSGSTGQPKGCMLENKGIINHLYSKIDSLKIDAATTICHTSELHFVGGLWQLWAPLISGGRVVLGSKEDLYSLERILDLVKKYEVKVLEIIPSQLNEYLSHEKGIALGNIKTLILTGEKLNPVFVSRCYKGNPGVEIVNTYGQTEFSDVTASYTIPNDPALTKVLVGKPIQNTRMYIVAADGSLCPIGVPGEICTSGDGLSKGYLNRPDLTAQKFVANPFEPGNKMFRTGDTGRWLANGNLEVLGRKDDLIKIRGFRIELREIENALLEHAAIQEAIVMYNDQQKEKELVAYLVCSRELARPEIDAFISAKLPKYMLPGKIITLEKMPLLPNGKINRKALMASEGKELTARSVYKAPSSDIEVRLCRLWQHVLGKERIGVLDNFFDLGGHSLKLTRLASHIYKEFGVKAELQELFEKVVLEEQARMIASSVSTTFTTIPLAKPAPHYPLSSSQRRLWVLSQFEEANIAYNIPGAYLLEGTVNTEALDQAFSKLIERHEILRTVFREDEDGNIRQFILPSENSGFTINYQRTDEVAPGNSVNDYLNEEYVKPFNLSTGPLMRATCFVGETGSVFAFVIHHVITDGWSMRILMKELFKLYNSFSIKKDADLRPLSVQYKDYASWQQEQLKGDGFMLHREYWLQQFEGELPVLHLPTDNPRPPVRSYRGGALRRRLDRKLFGDMTSICRQEDVTLFMNLVAAINVLLFRYSGQSDIVIGVPIAGRQHADLEDQIGLYINMLALRTRFSGEDSFLDLLAQVKELTLAAYRHQAYPFDELVNNLPSKRDMSRSPLFDVLVVLQNTENATEENTNSVHDLQVQHYQGPADTISRFDLSFIFEEYSGELVVNVTYSKDIFTENTISKLLFHLEQLMAAVLVQPQLQLGRIDFLSADEKKELLDQFNNTHSEYPRYETIVSLFEQQVSQHPNAGALTCNDISLTYQQFNEKANRLGAYLRSRYQVQPDDVIAIKLQRSVDLVIAIWGVLKSGAAYLPMDPAFPDSRIEYMLTDGGAKAVLDDSEWQRFMEEQEEYSTENLPLINRPQDIAYVIYTSGSTGQPKGVMIEHRQVVSFIENYRDKFFLNTEMVLGATASYTFDVSILELLGTLMTGMQVRWFNHTEPEFILEAIIKGDINMLQVTPTRLVQLMDCDNAAANILQQLKVLLTGGEPLSQVLYDQMKEWQHVRVINSYGPTETTIYSTSLDLACSDELTIGRPLWNEQIYITDNWLQLVPVGVVGEICIGGEGLARGYINKVELTAEKFVNNPFTPGERMYKSGDYGRWRPDGTIEFTGRRDDQVKVRGYRIELGELENAILSHPLISAAVVKAFANGNNETELAAYYSAANTLDAANVRTHIAAMLPAYMIPSHFIQVDAFGLTTNGKTDKNNLPHPQIAGMGSNKYEAPNTDTERKLALLWQEILEKQNIGINSNFFETGGHSLKATRLIGQIHKSFQVKLTIKDIFEYPLLQELAALIDRSEKTSVRKIKPAAPQASYPLSSSQRRLWVLSQFQESNIAYNMPGVYVFEGAVNMAALEYCFNRLIARHEILRTVFKEEENGDIRQYIRSSEDVVFKIGYRDLRKDSAQEEKLQLEVKEEASIPFNLITGPLLRAALYQLSEEKWVFTYTMHHIISDGWSMEILIRELLLLYNGYINGEEHVFKPLRIQYRDYAVWQQDQLSGKALMAHKSYWLKQFEGELPVLSLTGDRTRPAVRTYNGAKIHKRFNEGVSKGLHALTREQGSTLFMGLVAAVNTLLNRYTGQEDIIIGTSIASRDHADLEDQIGFYVNTLALRTQFKGTDSYEELLNKVKQVTLGGYEHQVYPFDELVDELHLERDMSRSSLFDVMVVLPNTVNDKGGDAERMEGLKIKEFEGANAVVSKFELTFFFSVIAEELHVNIVYNKDIYNKSTIVRLCDHLEQILEAAIATPTTAINRLDYLSKEEKEQLSVMFAESSTVYPKDKTVVHLFEEQALLTPDETAIVFEGQSLSYRQLKEQTDKLANYLRTQCGIDTDDLVGIMVDRSANMIVALLGVLKSGGAYVAIEPDTPVRRKEFIIKDTAIRALITQTEYLFELDYYGGHVFAIDIQLEGIAVDVNLPAPNIQPQDLAYVIYTSGSTGEPKGVMINHRSLVDYVVGILDRTNIRDCKRFGLVSTIAADLGNTVLYPSLLTGGALHVFSEKDVMDGERMMAAGLDCIKIVPSHWKALQDESRLFLPNKCLVFGGEQLTADVIDLIRSANAQCEVYNHYGPSETTIGKLVNRIDVQNTGTTITLGRPFCNSCVYIVDDQYNLQPVGIVGEICIGGDGLARGYLNRDALTQEKFVANPFKQSERMYKTGDLGRWLADGTIEFLGRKDDQVKIRGYRIELGEIENTLKNHPAIENVIVLTVKSSTGGNELVAYIASKEALDKSVLRSYLSNNLPSYMVPGYYVALPELPLTKNGKIDRKKLPDPANNNLSSDKSYLAARTATEQKLVSIWEEVLGKERIGVKDDFFDLGGQSLKATRLASLIHKTFEVKVDFHELFTKTVLEDQAAFIEQTQKETGLNSVDNIDSAYDDWATLALSYNQRSYFSDWNLADKTVLSHYQFKEIDFKILQQALKLLVVRHEILRTALVQENGQLWQQVIPADEADINIRDVIEIDSNAAMGRIIQKEQAAPVDPRDYPLFFIRVYKAAGGNYYLVFKAHHIIMDGYTGEILRNDLMEYYEALSTGSYAAAPSSVPQYRHFVQWQQRFLSSEQGIKQQQYWLNKTKHLGRIMAADTGTIVTRTDSSATGLVCWLDADLYSQLDTFSKANALTKPVIVMTVLALSLQKLHHHRSDVALLTSVSGRASHLTGKPDVSKIAGYFVNYLIMALHIREEVKLIDFVAQVQEQFLEGLVHADYPFVKLIEEIPIADKQAFFDTMAFCNYRDYDFLKDAMFDVNQSGYTLETEARLVPMGPILCGTGLVAEEYINTVKLLFVFRNHKYMEPEMFEMATCFLRLLKQFLQTPDSSVSGIK